MTEKKIRETLEKQLQLLSERSDQREVDLPETTLAMCEVSRLLLELMPRPPIGSFSHREVV